jgi:hypothetical protein
VARISDKSPFYRTKETMSIDLALILNNKELHRGTKKAVVDNVLWTWSELDGKYMGCRYWSATARKTNNSKSKGLIHEHLIPRKVIKEKILSLESPTHETIYKFLESFCVGVVITKEEDKILNNLKLASSMPIDWDGKDRWLRYKNANILINPLPHDWE